MRSVWRAAGMTLAAGLLACGRERPHPTAAPAAPRAVRVERAQSVDRPTGEEFVGTVRARQTAAISSLVMGTVTSIPVGLGTRVRAGDALARIGVPDARGRCDAPASAITLRAPFAGVVTAKTGHEGETAKPGQPLLTLEDQGAMHLEAGVGERVVDLLKPGQTVSVRVDAIEHDLAGTVSAISPAADPATRTVLTEVDLPPDPALRSGLFGRLRLPPDGGRVVVVPVAALVRRGQLDTVFVVDGTTARLRMVRSGPERGGRVEITSGLEEGEAVVVSDAVELVDNQPVEVAR
jgi:multidrug efflux pump subunit AcrA (membrane-fusion protein)